MTEEKIFNVREAAVFLGLSPMTIRRRILEGVLHATLGSKKEGYQITETELLRFSKTLKPKKNSLNGMIGGLASVVPIATGAAIASSVLVGGVIGQFLGNIIGGTLFSTKKTGQNVDENNLTNLDNPNVLMSIISRLNEEVAYYDFQIEHQKQLLNHSEESNKKSAEEKLFQLKNEQFRIKREIKDLEIRKAVILNKQKDV